MTEQFSMARMPASNFNERKYSHPQVINIKNEIYILRIFKDHINIKIDKNSLLKKFYNNTLTTQMEQKHF